MSAVGVHLGDLAAGDPGLPVGDAQGAGPRGRAALVHRGLLPELAAERPARGDRALDALPGHALHPRDALLPRAQRQGRGGGQQPAVAARRPRRHQTRAPGTHVLSALIRAAGVRQSCRDRRAQDAIRRRDKERRKLLQFGLNFRRKIPPANFDRKRGGAFFRAVALPVISRARG